jgi:branched-chain amino acid transport system permease protein
MLRAVREDERAAAAYGRRVFFAKYRAYLFGAALAGLTGGLFAIFISAFNPSAWTPQELLVIYAAILVGGRGNPRGVILGVFVVYTGFIEFTRFLPSPASRPEFGPAMRQILIGLMIILMLKFRPEGIFRERPGVDTGQRPAGWWPGPLRALAAAASSGTGSAGPVVRAESAAPAGPGGVAGADAVGATGSEVPRRATAAGDDPEGLAARAARARPRDGQAAGEGGAE